MIPIEKEKKRAGEILAELKEEYPEVKIALDFKNPFQLLIATILSAQCTDARVNIVTKELFKKYKKPEDFIDATPDELEKDIYSTGFYKQKAKSIKECCKTLVDKYESKVPSDFEMLTKLPGVGRKTASVVAGNGFGIPAVAVDTHVKRISNLLGFIESEDPVKIELRLKELFKEKDWVILSHLIATHGRNICIARKPKCDCCVISKLCPSSKV
ncbi:MAG TPA: endonuclease III [Ignavibacteriaceae bacterium]|nr:endonuclease III [Ignavibacteriaceae bacterium]